MTVNKVFILAGAIALSIIPTPSFSGEVEQKEMMSVTEQLLPQIGEKYYYLNKKEKKAYKKNLLKYLKKVEKTGATGVGEGFNPCLRRDVNYLELDVLWCGEGFDPTTGKRLSTEDCDSTEDCM